ncbi:TolC family protein [Candidatus Binatia bacterium]|nr:TolC family protein [Candidatus Binatia bacterium]
MPRARGRAFRRRGAAVALVLAGVAFPAPAEVVAPRTLRECIAIALVNHPSLKAAAATVDAGQQRVRQAVSGYLPQISANFSPNRRQTSGLAGTGTDISATVRTFDFYTTGFSLSQVLFDFGRVLNGIQAVIASVDALAYDQATQRETVVLNVKRSFFNLLATRRLLVVADETVEQNRKQLELAQEKLNVGLAPRFDVTQAEVQLANGELNQVTARNAVALAQVTLRNALGVTEPVEFDIVDTLETPPVELNEAQALALAYDRRSELLSLRAQEATKLAEIAALYKDYLPNVTGSATYNWSGTDYPLQDTWNVGASVNMSLFSGGLTTAQIGEAKATLNSIRFSAEVTRQDIALEVREALVRLQEARESIRVAEKGFRRARENLDLAGERYAQGVGTFLELTDAQTSYTSADASYVQALYNYRIAVAALERATAQPIPTAD